jgi:hypothetical protein
VTHRRGLIRLWIVASIIGVPLLANADFQQRAQFWDKLDNHIIEECVNEEWRFPSHPDAFECDRQRGAMKTIFERENTTPSSYWAWTLSWAFLADLVVTAALFSIFLVGRWVWRGFKD